MFARRLVAWLPAALVVAGGLAVVSAQADEPQIVIDNVEVQGPSEYSLGIGCEPAGEALRAQLRLKEGQGLIVTHVVPKSAAEKAGLQLNDVIVGVGDDPIGEVEGLARRVAEAKGQELALQVMRGGERQTIEVMPAKRDDVRIWQWDGRLPRDKEGQVGEAMKRALEWMEKQRQGLPQPPHAAFGYSVRKPALPEDMEVSITKRGDQPAKIVVKQGDKAWETTEDKLQDLPVEVRGHVAGMLGGPRAFVAARTMPGDPAPKPFQIEIDERPWEKQLKAMQEQIEQLRRSVEQLRKPVPPPVRPPEGASAPRERQSI